MILDLKTGKMPSFGAWRSPVAYLNGVQGVVGSNPIAPTEKGRKSLFYCIQDFKVTLKTNKKISK